MRAIYEPRGAAREYAPLAVSTHRGCTVGCRYCYCPEVLGLRTPEKVAEWRKASVPRRGILDKIKRDCADLEQAGDEREILLSFTHDPCADDNMDTLIEVFNILADANRKVSVLTKRPSRLMPFLPIFRDNAWKFATTLCWTDDAHRRFWEPVADEVDFRVECLARAHGFGVETWLSVEPVIITDEALGAIRRCWAVADEVRVGKLNGRCNETRRIERETDWTAFLRDVEGIWKKAKEIGVTSIGPRLVIKAALEAHRAKTA